MKIVRQNSEIIAAFVVNLSLILNPELIMLGTEIGSYPVLIDFIRKQIEGRELDVAKIASSPPGQRAVLWGCILLALTLSLRFCFRCPHCNFYREIRARVVSATLL